MDKILSARVDESVIRHIGLLAERLRVSKKTVIEKAIETYARQVEAETQEDLLDRTQGAWCRAESAEEILLAARRMMQASVERHRT
jgi:predicted transcriptional regulator